MISSTPPKRDAFASTKRAPSLTPENRAMSVGNLSLSSHGGAEVSTAVNKKQGMLRTNSSAHLTMSSYLESINDNDDGDDSGIFSESVTLFFLSLSMSKSSLFTHDTIVKNNKNHFHLSVYFLLPPGTCKPRGPLLLQNSLITLA